MNLITEYFTCTHLVNVIQQTESKGRYAGFLVSLFFMLCFFMLPWVLSMPAWVFLLLEKEQPLCLPSPAKKFPKQNSNCCLLPAQKGKISGFTKITAWRNPWTGQTITSPVASGTRSLGWAGCSVHLLGGKKEGCTCISTQAAAASLPPRYRGKRKGPGRGVSEKSNPIAARSAWSPLGMCWPWEAKQPLQGTRRFSHRCHSPPFQCCSAIFLALLCGLVNLELELLGTYYLRS